MCALAFTLYACQPAATDSAPAEEAQSTPPPAEFADAKYADLARKSIATLGSGDVAGWLNGFADNAVYNWNYGDSLVGKAAIAEYWTKRRTEVIESMKFSEEIYLPVKVNQPQATEAAGVWALCWYRVDATYKTGKSMTQYIHTALHFDSNDKVDILIQYLDRASIAAATTE